MESGQSDKPTFDFSRSSFHSTRWSVVIRAAGSDNHAKAAFGELCSHYWYPLYAFLRRQGRSAQDCEDQVQSFFASLMESETISRADPLRGKFRTYLIAVFKQFLAKVHEHDSAAKRKPSRQMLSIDDFNGESRYRREPSINITPELQFEYSWAMSLLDRSIERLKAESDSSGKSERFEALRSHITSCDEESYRELSERLKMTQGAVRVAVHRLRARYGEILREEVAQTLEDESDTDSELNILLRALRLGKS